MKFLIFGLGAVGFSFLSKLKESGFFDKEKFYCVDFNELAKKQFISLGGLESHFILKKIIKENYLELLCLLKSGDYLLDFAIDLKNLEILDYCLRNNIHYLSTADSSWNPDPSWKSNHQHYLEYLRLKSKYKNHQGNTSIVLFGMNPGLVSCFAKQCLKEIVEKDNSVYIKFFRKKLRKLLNEKKFGLVAKKIKVTDIQEIDNDNQTTNIPFEDDVCYSTWNVYAYYYETISSPEIVFKNKKSFFRYKEIYEADINDLYLALFKPGFEYKSGTFSPQGFIDGHISTHEEVFTIRDLFKYKKYRPNVHFVYSPSKYAYNSIINFKYSAPKKMHLITKDEIVSGGESVGIIIQGKRFKTRYFGNYLDTTLLKESATILQVSASSYAAFIYMLKHNKEGLLFPEDMDEDELLDSAKEYLKEYLSLECPKIKMTLGKE